MVPRRLFGTIRIPVCNSVDDFQMFRIGGLRSLGSTKRITMKKCESVLHLGEGLHEVLVTGRLVNRLMQTAIIIHCFLRFAPVAKKLLMQMAEECNVGLNSMLRGKSGG